ncbi:MAG: hypothetical protein LQ351_004806 [Letrouitia transgressa]|nr:MAG: hypothetical protein LQ351_004806 [Letrouitia transgressa]
MASKPSTSMITRSKATALSKVREEKEKSSVHYVSTSILPRPSKPNPKRRKKPAFLDEDPDSFDQTPRISESVSLEKQERGLRRFRDKPPQSFLLKLERALSQRMFVVSRSRVGTGEVPEEVIEIAGSTGNIRTPWQDDEYNIENVKAKGRLNEEGYVNIGSYFGLSGIRGISRKIKH